MSEGLGRSDAIRDRPYDRDQLDLMIMTAVRKANRDALRRPDQCTARLQESADRLGIGDRGAKVDTAIRFRLRDVKVVIQGSTDDLAGVRNRAQQLYVGKRIHRSGRQALEDGIPHLKSEEHTSEL